VYYSPLCPESLAIVAFCIKINVAFEPIKVDIFSENQKLKELVEMLPSKVRWPIIDLEGQIIVGRY
jgi:glutaredoxin-related protein